MPADEGDRTLGASYRLDERLGRGATGEVWRATDERTGEAVAVKVLHREHLDDETLVRRFVAERSFLLALRHPNVVRVRDLVVERYRLAVVMELVAGGTLRDALQPGGPLPPALALRVVAAVLDGLAEAHDQGVVHADVKPDNVLLDPAWRDLRPGAVKLSDFGVAALVAGRPSTDPDVVGTPEYLAPERLVTGALDAPADVYAAGVLLHELLGGRTPFAGPGTAYDVARRHVTGVPPRLPVPGPVADLLAALLSKDPRRRPPARDAADGLRRVAPTVAGVPALGPQTPPPSYASALGGVTEVRGLRAPLPRRLRNPTG